MELDELYFELEWSFWDGAPGAYNLIRPKFHVKNVDDQLLEAGFKMILVLPNFANDGRVPEVKKWWDPRFVQNVSTVGKNVVIEWTSTQGVSPGQEIGLHEWGIYWEGWQESVDKNSLINPQVVILDREGNVLTGEWPLSVNQGSEERIPPELEVNFWSESPDDLVILKPKMTITQTAGDPLETGFTVRLRMVNPFPPGAKVLVPEKQWDTSEFEPVIDFQFEGNEMLLQWTSIGENLFTGRTAELGAWGMWAEGWPELEKENFLNAVVEIYDNQGNRVY